MFLQTNGLSKYDFECDVTTMMQQKSHGYWYNCLYSNWYNQLAFMVSPNDSLLSSGII